MRVGLEKVELLWEYGSLVWGVIRPEWMRGEKRDTGSHGITECG